MMKIVTIIGARPQFVKAAMVSRAIAGYNRHEDAGIEEFILHTGQHYDKNMNDVFLAGLGIKSPEWQLHCGGQASHSKMIAEMMLGIEQALLDCRPDYVLVYGDTNSTLAGALVASRLNVPLAHVEAGLRSFNKRMPEEINRILTDHVASLLFCPTQSAIMNLKNENIKEGIFYVGDVMYDAALYYGGMAEKQSAVLSRLGLGSKRYRLCTVHRAENTDNPECLAGIVHALAQIATGVMPVVWPLHPRTKICIERYGLDSIIASNGNVRLVEPVDYLDMVMLEKNAMTILTDSGGVQKEAYFHRVPCVTLREETEWTETVAAGWNQIAGCQTECILSCMEKNLEKREIADYGNGCSAEKIVSAMVRYKKMHT